MNGLPLRQFLVLACQNALRRWRAMTASSSAMRLSGSPSTNPKHALVASAVVAALLCGAGAAFAEDDSKALAEELANPLAALISGAFFGNYNGVVGSVREG